MQKVMTAALATFAAMLPFVPVPAPASVSGVYARRGEGELDYFELTSRDGALQGTYHVVRLDFGAQGGVRRRSFRVAGSVLDGHLVLNLCEDASVLSTYRWTAQVYVSGIRVQIPRQSGRKAGLVFARSSERAVSELYGLLTSDPQRRRRA